MPDKSWYVLAGSRQYGPYPLAAMEQFVAEGRVTPQTMVRQGETGAWAAAGHVLDFSHCPASAGGCPPGGLPPAGPMGYAPPPRSSRSTWVIPVVVGGVCLALFVMCLGVPMALFFFRASAARQWREVQVEELKRQEARQAEGEARKAIKEFESKRKEIEAKAGLPMDEPALKPDGPKTPVEAEPEPRSP
jgi:hypothetical protein